MPIWSIFCQSNAIILTYIVSNMQSCQERATSSGAPGARYFFQERERATFLQKVAGAGARYIFAKSSRRALLFCQK